MDAVALRLTIEDAEAQERAYPCPTLKSSVLTSSYSALRGLLRDRISDHTVLVGWPWPMIWCNV
eukprot:7735-Eustigmatos_ZCMA.PRE.1